MNLKTLTKHNRSGLTDCYFPVNEEDVKIANETIRKVYRKKRQLTAGDIVQFTNQYGEFSPRAIIEDTRDLKTDKELHICQAGSCWAGSSKNFVSISGGSFYSVNADDLVYAGRAKRNYTVWSHWGACANGAISVPITVNVWRNKHNCKYTTEFLDKHYISYCSEEWAKEHNSEYQYSEMSHYAWTNNIDISAWCILHKAFVSKVYNDGHSFEVWTPKVQNHYWIKNEEVLSMNGTHDVETMNGGIRDVCYVYSENKIDKYFGKDEYSYEEVSKKYFRYFDMSMEKTKQYVRDNDIQFPRDFIRE